MAIKSSSELQSIVLSTIVKDTYLMTRVIQYINEEFFDKYNYKLIFRALKYYYNKYSKIPSMNELLVLLEEFHKPEFGTIEVLKQEYITLYNTPRYDESCVIDKLTAFIKRNNVEKTLKDLLPQVSSGSELAIESIGSKLVEGLNFQIGKSNAFSLGQIDKLSEMRRAAIGSDDNPLIIKSVIDPLNHALQFKGFKPGDVVMICSPPGCFTGDTRILTLDGSSHTLEELYNEKLNEGIYGYDLSSKRIKVSEFSHIQLTKYTKDLVEVELDNGAKIKCTPDHKFLMRNGEYKSAESLSPTDNLMSIRRVAQSSGSHSTSNDEGITKVDNCLDESYGSGRYPRADSSKLSNSRNLILAESANYNHKVTRVNRLNLEEEVPVYDIVESKVSNNFALDLGDDSGIFVHNCGKTMYMINEGANAALQGFNVLHLFLGDMKEYDGFIRYASCLTGVLQDDIVAMSVEEQEEFIRLHNFQGTFNKITVASYAAGEINSKEMIQEVKRLQDEHHCHYDLINIDYADNLADSSDNMYKNGGDIYNDLSLLAGTNHSVIIVGSQPKTEFWDEEIIPKKGAAESAKKQHIIDVMLTMNKASKTANIGTIFTPKVRRGREGQLFRWRSSYEKAKIDIISESDYLTDKANL